MFSNFEYNFTEQPRPTSRPTTPRPKRSTRTASRPAATACASTRRASSCSRPLAHAAWQATPSPTLDRRQLHGLRCPLWHALSRRLRAQPAGSDFLDVPRNVRHRQPAPASPHAVVDRRDRSSTAWVPARRRPPTSNFGVQRHGLLAGGRRVKLTLCATCRDYPASESDGSAAEPSLPELRRPRHRGPAAQLGRNANAFLNT